MIFYFYFLSFSEFPNLFWIGKKLWWCFIIFWIFQLMVFFNFLNFFTIFFWILYSVAGRNSSKRFFFFSLFLGLFQSILASKEAIMVFSNFLNFFPIFLEFFIPGQVGTHRNDFFFFFFNFLIFSLSRHFLTYLGLKRSDNGVF